LPPTYYGLCRPFDDDGDGRRRGSRDERDDDGDGVENESDEDDDNDGQTDDEDDDDSVGERGLIASTSVNGGLPPLSLVGWVLLVGEAGDDSADRLSFGLENSLIFSDSGRNYALTYSLPQPPNGALLTVSVVTRVGRRSDYQFNFSTGACLLQKFEGGILKESKNLVFQVAQMPN